MSNSMLSEDKPEEGEAIPIKLVWASPEGVPTVYSNQLYITHAGDEFFLVFGELVTPFTIDRENPPEKLEIRPQIKVAVTPNNMMKFADAIKRNIEKYRDRELDEAERDDEE